MIVINCQRYKASAGGSGGALCALRRFVCVARRLLRHLRAGAARLREADRDRLLAARDLLARSPLRSVPRLRSRITFSTFFDAFLLYFLAMGAPFRQPCRVEKSTKRASSDAAVGGGATGLLAAAELAMTACSVCLQLR